MLLANKMAVGGLSPTLLGGVQMIFAVVTCYGMQFMCGTKIDTLWDKDKLKAYGIYAASFVMAIYANMRALALSNVETVVVFRAASPIAVAALDWMFLGRALPSARSLFALLAVAVGAVVYACFDSQLEVTGLSAYRWAFTYYCLICFEMTYGKKVTSSVKMDSVWGSVLFTNALSVAPTMGLGLALGEWEFADVSPTFSAMSPGALGVLAFSCVTGTLIGYTGWYCRGLVSATTYTVVGVVNKFLTIILNVLVWDKHASPGGLAALSVCLVAGSFYRQAPMRSEAQLPLTSESDSKAIR